MRNIIHKSIGGELLNHSQSTEKNYLSPILTNFKTIESNARPQTDLCMTLPVQVIF